jgi:hypothetical protein
MAGSAYTPHRGDTPAGKMLQSVSGMLRRDTELIKPTICLALCGNRLR